MGTMLRLKDVSAGYGGFQALFGVSLEIDAGEAIAVIGPNGAGKTTLIDIVTGLTRPTTGTVHFNGQDITRLREHRRVRLGIGRSFQLPRPFHSLSLADNLRIPLLFTVNSRHGPHLTEPQIV